ncbi:D-inositol-3-phosphate glycosyltransferase [compost metagenome]
MRTGISCNRFGRGGGFERYAMDLVRGMIARGERPAVFARRFDRGLPELAAIDAHPIHVRWLPGKMRDYLFSWGMRNAHRHCDVLIGCNRVVGADLAICGGTHRGYLLAAQRPATFWDQRQITLEIRHYAAARHVVAHSRLMAQELRTLYGVPESKLSLLYPPVDCTRFGTVDDAHRARLRAAFGFGDAPVFLFPSSDHRRKGLPLLARALAASHSGAIIAVAGRPVGEDLPGVRELGYCDNMADLYRAADYTVLASNYEPFGLVGVESVLCGTPVIMADNIACLEVIAPEAALTFSRQDVAQCASAMAKAAVLAKAGNARIAAPLQALRYNPEPAAHLDALLALAGTSPHA